MARPVTLLYALAPMSALPRHGSVLSRALGLLCLTPLVHAGLAAQDPDATFEADQTEIPSGRVLQLSLDDAVRIAVQKNLDLEFEALTSEIARFNALGSWGSFDPVVSASGTRIDDENQGQSQLAGGDVIKTKSWDFSSGLNVPIFFTGGSFDLSYFHQNTETNNSFSLFDTSTSDTITASFNQPLLRGAWYRFATTAQRGREVDYQAQLEREKSVRQNLILSVYQAYWDLVSGIDQVGVREVAVQRAEQQLEQDQRRFELGAGTEVDILQSETQVATQYEVLLNARFQLRQSEDVLRQLLFQKAEGDIGDFLDEWDWPIEPLTQLPQVEEMETDWRRSLQLAIENRAEVWQRRFEIDAAEVQLEAARSDWLPQLDVTLSSSSSGFDPDPDESLDTATDWDFADNRATLEFSIPVLNRTARYGLRSARAGMRQARLALDQQELAILAEVREAVRDVRYRTEALLAAEKSATLAERQLEAEQVRMDIGLSTTFQVLQFQEDLAAARSTEVLARAAYAKALVNLIYVEGQLDIEPMDEPLEEDANE